MKRERDVDIEHAEAVQREIDERMLLDAYLEGQRAGALGLRAGLNPWADTYSQEYKRWEAGRAAGELARLGSHLSTNKRREAMNDLVRFDSHLPQSAAAIRTQVNLIQEVMHAVMKEGTHYGKIPGTPKPSLWKPGAEVLCTTFHIAPSYRVEDLSLLDSVRYRVTCIGTHQATSIVMGEGVGECSSNEEKYKWRRAASDKEFENTAEDRRRVKYGFNSQQSREFEIKQVRTEPADLANTILKMAAKRAQVAMALNVTAASDIFTQDIEDLPEGLQHTETETRGVVNKPRAKPKPTPTAAKPAPAAEAARPATQEAAPEGAQPQAAGDPNAKLSDGQKRILKARIDMAHVTSEQFAKKFGASLDEMPAAKFNDAAAWVREMAEANAGSE